MSRRTHKTSSHIYRGINTTYSLIGDGNLTDISTNELLQHKHRYVRRTASVILSRKHEKQKINRVGCRESHRNINVSKLNSNNLKSYTPVQVTTSTSRDTTSNTISFTQEELINFWKDLSGAMKRDLLRVHRDAYLSALDQFLVQHHLCCECHDNVIAEWEDHERKRAGTRSLQDVFTLFPPIVYEDDDDDDTDDYVEDSDDLLEDENEFDGNDENDGNDGNFDLNDWTENEFCRNLGIMQENEISSRYIHQMRHHHQLHHRTHHMDSNRLNLNLNVNVNINLNVNIGNETKRLMDTDIRSVMQTPSALEEEELLQLMQQEERYIIIRDDRLEFIMDLIRCGEQVTDDTNIGKIPTRNADVHSSQDRDMTESGDNDESECPGANTPYLAQEFLLEVMAIKFREQLEKAYQAALQHSLAVQAELLRDEIAELEASQKLQINTTTKSKTKKDKKKRKKSKIKKTSLQYSLDQPKSDEIFDNSFFETGSNSDEIMQNEKSNDMETEEQAAIDEEVENFRRLLESQSIQGAKPKLKLVLPPGTFSLTS